MQEPIERFEQMVSVVPITGCWMWMGTIATNGYGRFNVCGYRMRAAHRFAYEAFIGPIPKGLEIDHLCRNKWCVNPDHLEPVTRAENNRRSRIAS